MAKDCCDHGSGQKHAETVTGLLERPLYSPGLILEDSDLTAAVDYTRELSRLLFSQLFGCGVVCGLQVSVDDDCDLNVTVAPGLALDGRGDPLQVTKPVTIKLGKSDGVMPGINRAPPEKTRFWVMLCGDEKRCAPRATMCDGDGFDAVREATRARALTQVSISFDRPDCVCECARQTSEERADDDYYDGFVEAMLPRPVAAAADGRDGRAPGADGGPDRPAPDISRCQADHEGREDCADGCGGGGSCGCGCCVLLAMVTWFGPEEAWGVLNRGVRRFIRPKLLIDPITDARPETRGRPAS